MKIKKILIVFLIILIIISIIITIIYFKFKDEVNINNDINGYFENSMISYGEEIVKNNDWISSHKFDNEYYIYLDELEENGAIDSKILDVIDCNYSNTYLKIIKNGNNYTFETNISCTFNIDSDGKYYSNDNLIQYLENLGPVVIESFDYKNYDSNTYGVSLTQLEDVYEFDLSMFKDNYDFDKSYLYINTTRQDNEYLFDYDVILTKKEK